MQTQTEIVSFTQVFSPVLQKIDHWRYVRNLRKEKRQLENSIQHDEREIKEKRENIAKAQKRHLIVARLLADEGIRE